MAITDISSALAQYNANLGWQVSPASAGLALEAVRYLLVNRPKEAADQGSSINYESLTTELTALQKFTGATNPRAFGRSRFNTASYDGDSVQ